MLVLYVIDNSSYVDSLNKSLSFATKPYEVDVNKVTLPDEERQYDLIVIHYSNGKHGNGERQSHRTWSHGENCLAFLRGLYVENESRKGNGTDEYFDLGAKLRSQGSGDAVTLVISGADDFYPSARRLRAQIPERLLLKSITQARLRLERIRQRTDIQELRGDSLWQAIEGYQPGLEEKLEILHLCLTPNGAEQVAARIRAKENSFDFLAPDISELVSTLAGGVSPDSEFSNCFSQQYIEVLTDIRDILLKPE